MLAPSKLMTKSDFKLISAKRGYHETSSRVCHQEQLQALVQRKSIALPVSWLSFCKQQQRTQYHKGSIWSEKANDTR